MGGAGFVGLVGCCVGAGFAGGAFVPAVTFGVRPKSRTMRGFPPSRENTFQPSFPTVVSTTMRTVFSSNCAARTPETRGEST